mmetsp:Transcript_25268/g.61447  ORF Transcript_25268/g.61447 Transcript_25268/m.61447 type:complete len:144 (+) Transcript_25268:231-662(+)
MPKDAEEAGDKGESMFANKARWPEFLPDPDTTEEERKRLEDTDSSEFSDMRDRFFEAAEDLFVGKSATCSADDLEKWFLSAGYCDSKYQVAPIARVFLKLDIIRPKKKDSDGFVPGSRVDLYTPGPMCPIYVPEEWNPLPCMN